MNGLSVKQDGIQGGGGRSETEGDGERTTEGEVWWLYKIDRIQQQVRYGSIQGTTSL